MRTNAVEALLFISRGTFVGEKKGKKSKVEGKREMLRPKQALKQYAESSWEGGGPSERKNARVLGVPQFQLDPFYYSRRWDF